MNNVVYYFLHCKDNLAHYLYCLCAVPWQDSPTWRSLWCWLYFLHKHTQVSLLDNYTNKKVRYLLMFISHVIDKFKLGDKMIYLHFLSWIRVLTNIMGWKFVFLTSACCVRSRYLLNESATAVELHVVVRIYYVYVLELITECGNGSQLKPYCVHHVSVPSFCN